MLGTRISAWPFNPAWIFLNHGWLSLPGTSKGIRNVEDLGDRKRYGIFEVEGGIPSS